MATSITTVTALSSCHIVPSNSNPFHLLQSCHPGRSLCHFPEEYFYYFLCWISCFFGCCCCCLTLGDPMDCSMPGFPVLHHLPEFAHTRVHWVRDGISPFLYLFSRRMPSFGRACLGDFFLKLIHSRKKPSSSLIHKDSLDKYGILEQHHLSSEIWRNGSVPSWFRSYEGTPNKDLLYSTWNSAQLWVGAWWEGRGVWGRVYIYGWNPSLFTWNYHIVNWL